MTVIETVIKNKLNRKEYYFILKKRSCKPSKKLFAKAMELWFKMKEKENKDEN